MLQRPINRAIRRQRAAGAQIPAANDGINAVSTLAALPPTQCVFSFNLLSEEKGQTLRPGYIEWANGWTGEYGKTIIPFEGNTSADDKLFVANEEGIWDVTTSGETSPTQVVTFPSSANDAGFCSYVNFTNDGGTRYLLVCDATNGYYHWDSSTNTWTKVAAGAGAGQINGADPADFNYVMVWKERVWFIEKETARAWYLPTQALAGTVNSVNFGAQFVAGGFLVALHSWTLDGGDGVDDLLVGLSTSGDVVIYQGTNPSSASNFGTVGVWQVGALPKGNRIALEFAGELYILSVRGLVKASQLIQGNIEQPQAYLSYPIAPFIRRAMTDGFSQDFWHIHADAKSSRLTVHAPVISNGEYWTFSYYFGNSSWSIMRGLKKVHTASWRSTVYWLDSSQEKMYYEGGNSDAVYLDTADGEPQAITGDTLSFFSTLEAPARIKRCQFIKPVFLATLTPNYTANPRYDFDVGDILTTPVATVSDDTGVWDTSTWDNSVWAGDPGSFTFVRGGGRGMGTTVAVALRVVSSSPCTLLAYDVMYDAGGYL